MSARRRRTQMTETDEQLMARYRDGDAAAFDTLYRRHRGPVFRYVKRLAAAGMDAEALFQDAWMRVIQARTQWRRGESFRPWLYRIAHNRVVDELRRHGHVAVDDEHDPDAVPSATPVAPAFPARFVAWDGAGFDGCAVLPTLCYQGYISTC